MDLEDMTSAELHELMSRVREAAEARYRADRDRSNDTSLGDLVTAGMAWLDVHAPGHVERFDPDTFDVMCTYDRVNDRPRRCVLMHAFGTESWDEVEQRTKHLLADGEFALHGFMVSFDHRLKTTERYATYDQRIEDLSAAWRVAYAARRGN